MPERRIGTEPSFRLKLREDSLLPSFYESHFSEIAGYPKVADRNGGKPVQFPIYRVVGKVAV